MLTEHHQWPVIIILLFISNTVVAEALKPFSSDGCSQFPDGTLSDKNLWCDCCITHDLAYWQGGSRQQKKQADEALRDCILKTSNSSLLAETMYTGVRLGGLPIFPVWYRWGYGWQYGRGFQSLNQLEKQQVTVQLLKYKSTLPKTYCDFEYPPVIMINETWQEFVKNLK